MTFLPGFERHPMEELGRFAPGHPPRLVLHTTEGSTIEGAEAAYRQKRSAPQITVDAGRRRKVQHMSLDIAARALRSGTGGIETNRANAVQVEIVGFAKDSPARPAEELRWLGAEVVGPILRARNIPARTVPFVGNEGFGMNAPQRFSAATWKAFSGVCGHQHVPPKNDHWDPGVLDVAAVLRAAGIGVLGVEEEEEMHYVTFQGHPHVFGVYADHMEHVPNEAHLTYLGGKGRVEQKTMQDGLVHLPVRTRRADRTVVDVPLTEFLGG